MTPRTIALAGLLLATACGRFRFDEQPDARTGDGVPIVPACTAGERDDAPYANSSSGGDGLSAATAFTICTAQQLDQIGQHPEHWARHFKLISDIDLSALGREVTMIGTMAMPFTGELDGQGHTIANLRFDQPTTDFVGLISHAGDASVHDLSLIAVDVRVHSYSAALVAYADGSLLLVDRVSVSGMVSGTDNVGAVLGMNSSSSPIPRALLRDITVSVDVYGSGSVGGVVGNTDGGRIERATASGTVTGDLEVGGIAGNGDMIIVLESSSSATIAAQMGGGGLVGGSSFSVSRFEASSATGSVTCTISGDHCGGLVGFAEGSFVRSHATGDVTCNGDTCGGLVGYTSSLITQSYATGRVSGRDSIGGLIGDAECPITDSYATGDVTGRNFVGGVIGNILYGQSVDRVYATGRVMGQDSIGGAVGASTGGGTSTLAASFATGAVSGNSAAGQVSSFFGGPGSVTFDGNYHDTAVICTNTAGACSSSSVGTSVTTFYTPASPPLDLWDFTNIWIVQPGDFPRLR